MNLSDEIRKQIENNKALKLAVGEINNHLSILEELVRKDIMEQVDEAYQKGLEEGKKAFYLLDAECDSEYQRGLDDAWECAKKLFSTMSETEIEKVFPTEWENGFHGLMQMKPQYAIEKLKAYEKKADDEIKVGDEVRDDDGETYVITCINDDGTFDALYPDGTAFSRADMSIIYELTGRHFDIDKILEEMRT